MTYKTDGAQAIRTSDGSIFFCPLASGSKGNAIYLETGKSKILFDAGISAKSLEQKLNVFGRSISDLDAIIISHEHHDHIAGLKTITSKYNTPLITNKPTAEAIVEHLHGSCPKFHIFTTGEPFEWKDLEISPFSVQHDGREPAAFSIKTGNKKISICTDLGFVTSSVRHHLKGSNLLYLESNHKPEMVFASSRPDTYKKRVLSRLGHLSNEESTNLIRDVLHDELKIIYLAHLSQECNTEEIAKMSALSMLEREGAKIPVEIAKQAEISRPTQLFDSKNSSLHNKAAAPFNVSEYLSV